MFVEFCKTAGRDFSNYFFPHFGESNSECNIMHFSANNLNINKQQDHEFIMQQSTERVFSLPQFYTKQEIMQRSLWCRERRSVMFRPGVERLGRCFKLWAWRWFQIHLGKMWANCDKKKVLDWETPHLHLYTEEKNPKQTFFGRTKSYLNEAGN